MRFLGLLLLVLSIGYAAVVRFSEMRRLSLFPTDSLESELRHIDIDLTSYDRDMSLPPGGMDELAQMRSQKRWIRWEILRRKNRTDQYASWAFIAGLLGVLLPTLASLIRGRQDPMKPTGVQKNLNIPETPAREEYVDEWEFKRKSESGFKTREEAVAWLLQDPLLKCDYCSGELRSTFAGQREALQLVTFYKKVPDGARDLRVVYGSLWFAKAASELKCAQCQRVLQR